MSTFTNKNSLRTIEAQFVQKLKNNEARPKFTGSSKKQSVYTNANHACSKYCRLQIYFMPQGVFQEHSHCYVKRKK